MINEPYGNLNNFIEKCLEIQKNLDLYPCQLEMLSRLSYHSGPDDVISYVTFSCKLTHYLYKGHTSGIPHRNLIYEFATLIKETCASNCPYKCGISIKHIKTLIKLNSQKDRCENNDS